MADITYRGFEKEDEQGVLRLFQASFGVSRDREQWRWEFLGGPEESVIVVAESGGKIVGHYAVLPRRLRIGDKLERAGLVVDVMTDPGFGRRGIFVTSAAKAFELSKAAGISLLVGFPNEAAIKGHKKANWHEVGCARVFVRPLRLSAVARALGRRSPRSNDKRLDRVPGQSAKPSLLQKRGGLGLTVVTVEGLLALGDELLEFISEALPRSAVCADRRIEWLRWRLSDPLGAHSVLVVRDSASSKLVGLAILKMKDYKGMRVGAVFDLIVPRNRGSARKLLLKNAIRKSRLEGCELCLMLGSPAEHNALSMISSGLFPTPKKLMFIVRAVDGTAPPDELLDIRNWHLQLIDHDVI